MSRKSSKKSDSTSKSSLPQIGIFREGGRTAMYNRLILKVLLDGDLEARPLAGKIKEIMSPSDAKESVLEKRYRVQKIYSVIQRKNGRLNDLKNKGYVAEMDGVWDITKKGLIALSIEEPELVQSIIKQNKEKLAEMLNSGSYEVTNVFGLKIDLSELKPYFKQIDFGLIFKLIVDESKVLLQSGFELDRIQEGDFLGIVYNALLTKGKISEIMKKIMSADEGEKNG
jgi:hypothetical protein